MKASDVIINMTARGCYHFTTQEMAQAMGSSLTATRAALRRLKRHGSIATPYRGFHVIISPEYRSIGCLPADQFIQQLMERLGLEYYVALLSAAQYHGAAHHQPQIFQVMVQKNRSLLTCGAVRVAFIARREIDKIPVMSFNSPRGHVVVSSPEATAFDLVGYQAHAGGFDNVATVLSELSDVIEPNRLVAAASFSPVPWAQRLGYLLSLVEKDELAAALDRHLARSSCETVPLDPGSDLSSAPRESRWKLLVNVQVEPDL